MKALLAFFFLVFGSSLTLEDLKAQKAKEKSENKKRASSSAGTSLKKQESKYFSDEMLKLSILTGSTESAHRNGLILELPSFIEIKQSSAFSSPPIKSTYSPYVSLQSLTSSQYVLLGQGNQSKISKQKTSDQIQIIGISNRVKPLNNSQVGAIFRVGVAHLKHDSLRNLNDSQHLFTSFGMELHFLSRSKVKSEWNISSLFFEGSYIIDDSPKNWLLGPSFVAGFTWMHNVKLSL